MAIENQNQSTIAAAAQDLPGAVGDPTARLTIPAYPTPARQPREALGLPPATDPAFQKQLDDTFAKSLDALKENAGKLDSLSASYLKGEIPADVQAQLRRLTSERGMASGIGRGQAGQALTTRDLGLTSLDLQGQGAQLTQAANAVHETLGRLAEARSQFNKSFDMETAKFIEDTRRTDISVQQLDMARRQFNSQQNMALVQQIVGLAGSRAELQYRLAAADIEDTNVIGAMDQIIGQLDKLIEQSSLTI